MYRKGFYGYLKWIDSFCDEEVEGVLLTRMTGVKEKKNINIFYYDIDISIIMVTNSYKDNHNKHMIWCFIFAKHGFWNFSLKFLSTAIVIVDLM